MGPERAPTLLSLAVWACAPPTALAFRRAQQEPQVTKLQCIAHSEAPTPQAGLWRAALEGAAPAPECSAWPPERFAAYRGAEALPLSSRWWAPSVGRLYRPTRSDFERAFAPAGYSGSRLRLRRFLLQLMAGGPVEVAVLGGSMTVGAESAASWPQLFEEHLRSMGHNLTVNNLARASTGAEFAADHLMGAPEMARSGLVIIDTSINDHKDWWRLADTSAGRDRDTYDSLLQQLLGLAHRPAILDLATVHFDGGSPYNDLEVHCSRNLRGFPHAGAELFQVPILSFPDAMCSCCGPRGLWFGNQHPNSTTHDAVARTVVAALSLEMESSCKPGGLDVADFPPAQQALQTPPYVKCMRLRQRFSVDFTASSAEEASALVRDSFGWEFTRDLPSKPFGWMVPSHAPPGLSISFKVNASRGGWIRMDYLSTYTNIGSIVCWVDGIGGPSTGCAIDAHLNGDFSVVRSAYIGLPGNAGGRTLHCSTSGGGKFKVMGLASC